MSFGFMRTPLGQNFLINEGIAQKIVQSANIKDGNILEIGPGKGMLTKYLAEKAKKLLAIEIDRSLAAELERRSYKNTEISRDDILKINLPKLIEENNFQDYKVVANLPYYITSKIIRLLLETKCPPQEMILMVQREVGERIVARDGKESILSISVKFYAEPEILFNVPRENFDPVPEVDSVVIRIRRKDIISDVDIKNFFSLVKSGFSAKRKTLANNLASGLHLPKEKIAQTLKKAGLEPGVRAEKLTLEDWEKLYDNLIREVKNGRFENIA
jgi:16S rRNA (adenine1518-N6/adenine1519-N6)-dimethyltransferase